MIDFEKERQKITDIANNYNPHKRFENPNRIDNIKDDPQVKNAFKKVKKQNNPIQRRTFAGKNHGTFGGYNISKKKTISKKQNQNTTFQRIKDDINKGFDDFNAGLAKTVDFFLPDSVTVKPVQKVIDKYKSMAEESEKKFEKTHKTTASKIGGNLISGLVGALPNLVLGVMTAGGSTGAEVGGALAAEGGAIAKSTAQILQNVVKTNAKNPMFWNSFSQIAGPTYEKEKQRGASEAQAITSAMLNGVVGSAIEIGGGIETLKPIDYKNMPLKEVLKSLGKTTLDTAKEEGLEEIQQYSVEGLSSLASGSVNPKDISNWISFKKDKDAVINPLAQFEQGAYGATIGGIMGGGHSIINAGMQRAVNKPNVKLQAYKSTDTIINNDKTVNPVTNNPQQVNQENRQDEIKKKYINDINRLKAAQPNEYIINDSKLLSIKKDAEGNEYEITIDNKPFKATYSETKDFLKAYSELQIQNENNKNVVQLEAQKNSQTVIPETELGEHIWTDIEKDVINRIAKRSNLEVVVEDLPLGINGQIEGNRVTISKNCQNPTYQVLKHELTHHIEQSGHYDEFKDFVLRSMKARGNDVNANINGIIESYKDIGKDLTWGEAEQEYVAEFSEEYLFNSEQSIERLARENPNLFRRIYEWIKDTIAKIGASAETKMLINAQRMYEKALRNITINHEENIRLSAIKGAEKDSIKRQIAENLDMLDKNVIVSSVNYESMKGRTRTQIMNFYIEKLKSKIAAPIQREGFGNVRFEIKDISKSLEYLNNDAERAAMLTVPDIIKRGNEIYDRQNHKERKYDTKTFAGVVKINGKKGVVGVVVKLGGKNRYKTHRILMPNGEEYVFETKKTEPTDVGMISKDNRGRTISSVLNDTITQDEIKSKDEVKESSTKVKMSVNKTLKSDISGVLNRTLPTDKNNRIINEEKNLLAIHNISNRNMKRALKQGGFPMPSIAITKDSAGHASFGEVSLIFGKNTIDPEINKDNAVYSGDAWTPVHPTIDYKAKKKVVEKLQNEYYELSRKIGYEKTNPLYSYAQETERMLSKHEGEMNLISDIKKDADIMRVYLEGVEGKKIDDQYETVEKRISAEEQQQFEFLIDKLGEKLINESAAPEGVLPINHWKKFYADNKEAIEAALNQYSESKKIERVPGKFQIKTIFYKLRQYIENGPVTYSKEYNAEKTNEIIKEAAKNSNYNNWVDRMFSGIEEKTGIRNNKDPFTKSGNRKSWDALHWENTLENIVSEMKTHENGEAMLGFMDIWGATAKKYKNIGEVKENINRISSTEDYEKAKENIGNRYLTFIGKVAPKNTSNEFITIDATATAVANAIRETTAPISLMKNLKKNGINVQHHQIKELVDIVSDIATMPVKYFEAKPERVVSFDEVEAAVLPDNTPEETINELKDMGIKVLTYEEGNEQERQQKVKALEDLKFSKKGNHIDYDGKLKSTSERLYNEAANKYKALFKNTEEIYEKEEDNVRTVPGMKKAERYEKRQLKKFNDEMLNILDAEKYEDNKAIKKDRQEMMGKIKEGTLSEEDKKRYFENMYYTALKEDAGYVDTYEQLRKNLKTARLVVTDRILSNITDFKYRKNEFKNIHFAQKGDLGIYIDDFYANQQERFPGLLPNVNTQEEMLEVLAEKANIYEEKYKKIESAMGSDEFYEYSWKKFNEQIENLKAESNIIERFKKSKEQGESFNLTNKDVKLYVEKINDLKKKVRKTVEQTLLTDEDTTLVGNLLDGKINEEYVRTHTENAENVLEVYEVKKALRQAQNVVRENGERSKEEISEKIQSLIKGAKLWKEKKAGWRFARETSERNFEDIAGKDADGIINYIYKPTHENEAASNKFKEAIRRRIRDENISTKRIYTVKRSLDIKDPYGYVKAPGLHEQLKMTKGKLSEADIIQLKGENLVDDDFVKDCGADPIVINKKVDIFKDIYNLTFEVANNVLMDFGYDPIEYRQDYFPHFSEDRSDSLIAKMLQKVGMDYNKNDLPTDIAGLTETFKPGKKFFANALQRQGSATEYNALKGLDIYLEGVSDVIYHTEDIQKRRILERELRIKFGEEGLKQEIEDINRMWKSGIIDTSRKDALMNDALEKGITSQGALVTWIRDDTDTLAGKKSYIDRPTEKLMSRGMYDLSRQLEGRVAANMVGINPASWLTNFIPLVQGGNVSYKDIVKGMAATLQNNIKHDNVWEESTFLTNRRGTDKLYKSTKDLWINRLTSPMEMIDQFTSESLVRAKYYEELHKGATETEALDIADRFAADTIADRSKGAVPTLFNAKNPVAKCLTMFQIEVNNQWSHLVKDIPRNSNSVAALTMALSRLMIGSYIYNDVYEKIIGRRPALDIFSWFNELYGDLTGKKIKNFVDMVMDNLNKDEEDETDKASKFVERVTKKSGGKATENIIENVAQDIPFVGGLIGGGRLPISSAIPNIGKIAKGLADVGTEDKTWENAKDTIGKEVVKPLLYLIPPVGGGQTKKIYESTNALIKKGTYAAGKDGKKKLEFPVDRTVGNAVKGLLFGKYAMEGGKEYVEGGFKKMSEEKTKAYLELLGKNMQPSKAAKAVKNVDVKSKKQMIKSVENLKMPDFEKNLIYQAFNPDSKVDYGKPETVDFASLTKAQQESVKNIQKDTGMTLKKNLKAYKIKKEYGGNILQAAALMEEGYKKELLKKMGYSDAEKGAITIAGYIKKSKANVKDYKEMWKTANTNNNTCVDQGEAKAYLYQRDDLTREQKYYIMRALCGGVADRNNPWY